MERRRGDGGIRSATHPEIHTNNSITNAVLSRFVYTLALHPEITSGDRSAAMGEDNPPVPTLMLVFQFVSINLSSGGNASMRLRAMRRLYLLMSRLPVVLRIPPGSNRS